MSGVDLKSLLKFIETAINTEGNEWFHDELALLIYKRIILEKDYDVKLAAMLLKEVGSIKKYIDNKIIPIIDFREITDIYTRYQLEADVIEMGKYRLGIVESETPFKDFCRFAHYQSENLVNYYYQKKFDSMPNIIKFIVNYNEYAANKMNTESLKFVFQINHNYKFIAITNCHSFDIKIKNTLYLVSQVRNNESHRSGKSYKTNDFEYNKFINDKDYNSVYNSLSYLYDIVVENTRDK